MTLHIQYPKLTLLTLSIILSYVFFELEFFAKIAYALNSHGYIAAFLGGIFFAFGFTAPLSVGLFIELSSSINIFIGAFIAGLGAFLADLSIFRFIRFSFRDEFEKLKLSFVFRKLSSLFDRHLTQKLKKYVLWTFAGFLIASPLPDEFGVSLLSGFTNINPRVFAVISYSCNTLGIFVILLLGRAV